MDVIQEITDIVNKLNEIDKYASTLQDKLRVENEKELDLLHYVENNKISMLWCYRFVKKMKDIRIDRRKIKNDIEILSRFADVKEKLSSETNRQFILAELHKKENQINQPYKNRQYTEEDMQKILKGVM